MSNKVTNLLIFLSGIAVGSVVTWQLVKKEYEQIAQAEIDSVKAHFKNTAVDAQIVQEDGEEYEIVEDDDDDADEYYEILENEGYVESAKSEEPVSYKKPYVISPDEFQEDIEYTNITFYYFADGVLTDENHEIVDDVEGTVGLDSLEHFGDYEDDAVHVRNERLVCEYEILFDQRNYSEVAMNKPHRVEEE